MPLSQQESTDRLSATADPSARVRVKFCGITRIEDAVAAARFGVDAIGLVFHPPSPRVVNAEQAAAICAALPPFVASVGLFVDADAARIESILARVPLDLLQFHGEEPPEVCRRFGRPYIKALRVRDPRQVAGQAGAYTDARGLLLDSYDRDRPGGTGQIWDWAQLALAAGPPIVLAGGLTPDNVGAAIALVRPYAVDVSSGIESRKGIKDPERMAAFMRGISSVQI